MNDFDAQLAYSEAASCEAFWDAIYRKAFPNLVSHMPCPGDYISQRMGIDRVLLLSNGQTLKIDEKKRVKVYDDILLERVSVDTDNAPGWIEKDLAIDFLAYAFMPTQRVWLFPWPLLRRAWLDNRARWVKEYREVRARNATYNTISTAVPIRTLCVAVANTMLVQLEVTP